MLPLTARLRTAAPKGDVIHPLRLRDGARFTRADGVMIGTMLIWGVNISAAKVVVQSVPASAFGLLRYAVATVVLAAILKRREESIGIRRGDVALLALIGAVGLGAYQMSFLAGISRVSASLAALILAVSPLLTAAVAAAWAHEPLSGRSGISLATSFAGVVLVIFGAGRDMSATWLGGVLILCAASAIALSAVWSKRPLRVYSSLRVTAWMCLFGAAVFVPTGVPAFATMTWSSLTPLVVGAMVAVILGGTVLGNLAWNHAVQQIGATRTAAYTYMQPVVGVMVAVALLDERLSPWQLLGGGVILVGLLLHPRPGRAPATPDISSPTTRLPGLPDT